MGLFNFLKKKEQAQPVENKQTAEQPAEKTHELYAGDLDKTNIIFHLVQKPIAERDNEWQELFLENIPMASFRCGNPQVEIGPDGYPYFQLFLPEPGLGFECYMIDRMKDDFLLANGLGVVINPTGSSADWVLSYGDILNYHLNKKFYSHEETAFSNPPGLEEIKKDEQVTIGQPSEAILPDIARKVLRKLIVDNGINDPKILLMIRKVKNSFGYSQDIVFNLTPDKFESIDSYKSMMYTITWFLPKHYTIIGMNDETFGDGFMDL